MVVAKRGFLVPGPFRELLHELCAQSPSVEGDRGGGWGALAARVGVHERRMRVYAGEVAGHGESGLVKVETVDRVCVALGRDIAGLYGPMYAAVALPEGDHEGENCVQCGEPMRVPAPLCGFCVEEGQL